MNNFSSETSYRDFLEMVGNLGDLSYHDLYEKLKKRVGDKNITSYSEFMDKCGNLGNLQYDELYLRIYPKNKNVKGGKRTIKRRKNRKSHKSRSRKY